MLMQYNTYIQIVFLASRSIVFFVGHSLGTCLRNRQSKLFGLRLPAISGDPEALDSCFKKNVVKIVFMVPVFHLDFDLLRSATCHICTFLCFEISKYPIKKQPQSFQKNRSSSSRLFLWKPPKKKNSPVLFSRSEYPLVLSIQKLRQENIDPLLLKFTEHPFI